LNGIFGDLHRSREQSDGAYEPHVVMLDQSIERHSEFVVGCHGTFVS
jgi:hypothetical protein